MHENPNREFSLRFGKEEMSTEEKRPREQRGLVPSRPVLTRLRRPYLFSRKRKDRGEKSAWLRLVLPASDFRRVPMFQASFHTIVTSRASWYAPPDTGEIRFATSCLRTVAVNRRCSRNFDGYYLLAGQVVGAGLCSAPTKRLDKPHPYTLICRYPIYRPST